MYEAMARQGRESIGYFLAWQLVDADLLCRVLGVRNNLFYLWKRGRAFRRLQCLEGVCREKREKCCVLGVSKREVCLVGPFLPISTHAVWNDRFNCFHQLTASISFALKPRKCGF